MLSVVCPDTVRADDDALARVVCPVATRVLVKILRAVSPVVDALVSTDVEAKILDVKVFKNLRVEDPREKVVSIDGVVLPAIVRRSVGVDDPIPTFPLARIVKSDVPVEDATLNGLVLADPCTLKVKLLEVAPTPAMVPVSRRSPIESDAGDVQRARKSLVDRKSVV